MNISQQIYDFKTAAVKPNMNLLDKTSFNLKEGQQFKVQVMSAEGNNYIVKSGKNMLKVDSSIPLSIGDKLEAQVVKTPEGQLSIQLVNIARSIKTRISESELLYQLQNLKLPADQENLNIARAMVEFQLPLSVKILTLIRQALAQLPRRNPMDVYSAGFLKQSNLPLNSKNITSLSNFLSAHPLTGSQLFELQSDLRKIAKSSLSEDFAKHWKFFSRLPRLIGEMILEPGAANQKALIGNLFKLAQQSGIEGAKKGMKPLDFGKIENFLEALLGKMPDGPEKALVAKAAEILGKFAGQLLAMGLINQAEKGEFYNYWYFQIPFMLDENTHTGELKITYRHDLGADPANLKLEFAVKTENLGEINFNLNILDSILEGKIQTSDSHVKRLVDKYIKELEEGLAGQNYRIGKLYVVSEEPCPIALDLRREEFESMQNVDMSV